LGFSVWVSLRVTLTLHLHPPSEGSTADPGRTGPGRTGTASVNDNCFLKCIRKNRLHGRGKRSVVSGERNQWRGNSCSPFQKFKAPYYWHIVSLLSEVQVSTFYANTFWSVSQTERQRHIRHRASHISAVVRSMRFR